MNENKHVLSVLVENKSGVLSRVIGLISRRGFNIDSLSVGPTEDPSRSRITIIVDADTEAYEQIVKQLNKLIDVIRLLDLTEGSHIAREMMLIKLGAIGSGRDEIMRLTNIFRGRIIDVTGKTYTIELTGTSDKLDAFIPALGDIPILETVRSGVSGIARGEKSLAL